MEKTMRKPMSQTTNKTSLSGGGDSSPLAIRFFEEIRKMGVFGAKYASILASPDEVEAHRIAAIEYPDEAI